MDFLKHLNSINLLNAQNTYHIRLILCTWHNHHATVTLGMRGQSKLNIALFSYFTSRSKISRGILVSEFSFSKESVSSFSIGSGFFTLISVSPILSTPPEGPLSINTKLNHRGLLVRRRKIGLIEGNAKCRHLNNMTCKGTLRQVFICLRPRTP